MTGVIRAYRPADERDVRRLVTSAFGGEGPVVAALVDDLRREHARAELVAVADGDVVGHVLLSRSWVDARRALVEVQVLSPLSVTPEHQGRGWGTALVAAALEAAATAGSSRPPREASPGRPPGSPSRPSRWRCSRVTRTG
jgi:putative acetyltransferase